MIHNRYIMPLSKDNFISLEVANIMVGMMVKTLDFFIIRETMIYRLPTETFQDVDLSENQAFLVTKILPDEHKGYHAIIATIEPLHKEGAPDKILIEGKLLDESHNEVGNFEAKLRLLEERWEGISQFKALRCFRPSSITIPNNTP